MKGFIITENCFDDEKIKLIEALPSGEQTLIIYFKLISIACKSNAGGYLIIDRSVPYSEEMLSILFGKTLQIVRFAINTLKEFGMIEETDKGFKVEEFEALFVDTEADKEREKERIRLSVQKSRKEKSALPEPTEKENKKHVYADNSIELTLARYLYSKMLENNPEAKKPNFQSWANDIRLMIERDKRKPDQIKNMIEWCQKDSFWKANILSTKKLREKYDQLKVKALEEYNRQQGNRPSGRQAEIDDIFSRLEGGSNNAIPTGIEGH